MKQFHDFSARMVTGITNTPAVFFRRGVARAGKILPTPPCREAVSSRVFSSFSRGGRRLLPSRKGRGSLKIEG